MSSGLAYCRTFCVTGFAGPTDSTFLVVKGRIRTSGPGQLESYGPGELVGELCFCDVRARQEDAVAVVASEVVEHSAESLVAEVRRDGGVARGVLELLCTRLAQARARAGEQALAPAPARIARRLLELAAAEGIAAGEARFLPRRPTHAELARAALASRERTSKVLADLRARGAIDYARSGPLRVFPDKLTAILRAM